MPRCTDISWTVCTVCTLGVHGSDRFEGPPEEGSRILIFPLFYRAGNKVTGSWSRSTWCRLGPPESVFSDGTIYRGHLTEKSWILRSERKRRLLHNFSGQKMTTECTIFPYTILHCFLHFSAVRRIQFRRPHSSLWPPGDQKVSKVTKWPLLTAFSRSDEWGRLKVPRKTAENTEKCGKQRKRAFQTPH